MRCGQVQLNAVTLCLYGKNDSGRRMKEVGTDGGTTGAFAGAVPVRRPLGRGCATRLCMVQRGGACAR